MLLCDARIFRVGVESNAGDASDDRVGWYQSGSVLEPTFASSFLFAIRTLCSNATIIFLSAPNLKLSATTRDSYCCERLSDRFARRAHLDLIIVCSSLFQAAEIPCHERHRVTGTYR